ncbi:MAG: FAD-binding oxidoreductase [Armatimonadota bacterium]
MGVTVRLNGRMMGRVTVPADADYDTARAVRNGRIDKCPALIAYAVSTADVVEAVRLARDENLPLSVRGAGHHIMGACVAEGGIVIDTSALKELTIDPDALTVKAGAGLTTGEFIGPLHEQGFIVPTGSHDSVGLAGITLSGGIGILMGKYGLVCDNLLSAEIVTADGEVRTANPTENPDLFWALRGGGGNFGVVTSLTFRIHPVEPTIAGIVLHPVSRVRDVLAFYREYTCGLPDEMNAFFVTMTGPGGMPVCGIMACYTGPSLDEGERLVAPLREFGPPVMAMLGPAPYLSLLDALKDNDPAGHHYAFASRGLPALTDGLLDVIAERAEAVSSPGSAVVLYHLHGVAARVALTETAFAARQIPYFLGAYAGWEPGEAAPHLAWLEKFVHAVEPYRAAVGYVGLSGECDSGEVQALYGENYRRLAQVKAAYDPENVFCHNHNILPASPI